MPETNENRGSPDPVTQPLLSFWSSYIEQANASTQAMLESFTGGGDAKVWQRQWFDAVSKSLDAYLRSPAFLQAMKLNTDAMIRAKMQVNESSQEFARQANIPTASDVHELSEQLQRFENLLVSRIESIEQRLEEIEKDLSAVEHSAGRKKKPKKKTKTGKKKSSNK